MRLFWLGFALGAVLAGAVGFLWHLAVVEGLAQLNEQKKAAKEVFVKLTSKARKAIPSSKFALPGKRAFPIEDKSHARAALSMAHNATPSEQTVIKEKVHSRFPGIGGGKGKSAPPPPAGKKIGAREMFGSGAPAKSTSSCPTCGQPMPSEQQSAPAPAMGGGSGAAMPSSPGAAGSY